MAIHVDLRLLVFVVILQLTGEAEEAVFPLPLDIILYHHLQIVPTKFINHWDLDQILLGRLLEGWLVLRLDLLDGDLAALLR